MVGVNQQDSSRCKRCAPTHTIIHIDTQHNSHRPLLTLYINSTLDKVMLNKNSSTLSPSLTMTGSANAVVVANAPAAPAVTLNHRLQAVAIAHNQ